MSDIKTIIIVEDESINFLFLKTILEKEGYIVIDNAKNSVEAFEKITSQKPDLAIIDIKLNDNTDGIELARKIRGEIGYFRHIYCTAFTEDSIIERSKETEPLGVISKPVNRAKLFKMLEKS